MVNQDEALAHNNACRWVRNYTHSLVSVAPLDSIDMDRAVGEAGTNRSYYMHFEVHPVVVSLSFVQVHILQPPGWLGVAVS